MKPIKFEQSNFTYTAPKGMDDCGDLPVFKGNADGYDVVVSAWQPSEEDKKRIAEGKPIYLQVVGNGMPPVALFTENPFNDEEVMDNSETILDWIAEFSVDNKPNTTRCIRLSNCKSKEEAYSRAEELLKITPEIVSVKRVFKEEIIT